MRASFWPSISAISSSGSPFIESVIWVAVFGQLLAQPAAEAAEAADDDVIPQFLDRVVHPSLAQPIGELQAHDDLAEVHYAEQEHPEAEHQEDHGEQPAAVGQRPHSPNPTVESVIVVM